jgi:hypothetical protein
LAPLWPLAFSVALRWPLPPTNTKVTVAAVSSLNMILPRAFFGNLSLDSFGGLVSAAGGFAPVVNAMSGPALVP